MADQELRHAERAYQQDSNDETASRLLTQQDRSGQTCRKIYVVAEHHYEYDDQSFTATGGYAGSKTAFVSRENAEKFLREDNRDLFLENCQRHGGQGSGLGGWADNHTLFPDDLPSDVDTFLNSVGISYEEIVINQGNLSDDMENFGVKIFEAWEKDQISDDILDKLIESSGLLYNEIIEVELQDGICGGIRG